MRVNPRIIGPILLAILFCLPPMPVHILQYFGSDSGSSVSSLSSIADRDNSTGGGRVSRSGSASGGSSSGGNGSSSGSDSGSGSDSD